MNKPVPARHYIREWRKHRGLSLRRLAARLENPDGSPVISYSSLSRIEKGLQPYGQEVLEALADALGTDPGSLIMRDPTRDAPIFSIWDHIPPQSRPEALAMLKALAKTGS